MRATLAFKSDAPRPRRAPALAKERQEGMLMAEPAAVIEGYDPEPGVEQDERAQEHRRLALETSDPAAALLHAVLALEARVDELTWHLARR